MADEYKDRKNDDIGDNHESSTNETTEANNMKKDNQALESMDDVTLIKLAEAEASEERLLNAANFLQKVKDKDLLTRKHRNILKWAATVRASMKSLLESPDDEGSSWTKQSETHGNRDFFVYYQIENGTNKLFCRIESAIESSLLVPLISVMNESSLYKTWMPSWQKPFKLGVQESNMLKEYGRGNQIIQVKVAMPLFLSTREATFHAVAVDVIEEEGAIAIQVNSETPQDDPVIPKPQRGVIRMDFENSMLIRGCPKDHPCYPKSHQDKKTKMKDGTVNESTPETEEGEEEIFHIGMRMTVNAKITGVPITLINFATRTVIGTMWAQLLQVAESVRNGTMASHGKAIEEKAELYDWIKGRMDVMVAKVKEEQKQKEREQNEEKDT